MSLKFKYKTKDEIPAQHAALYVASSATARLRLSSMPKARWTMFTIVGGAVAAVAAVEADGKTPVYGQDGATPLTFDEWVARQVVEAPHLFESSAGGGAVGHGSGGSVKIRSGEGRTGT